MRTARCHLRGQVLSEPQTSCAPKSLGSRGKNQAVSGCEEEFFQTDGSTLNSSSCNFMDKYIYIHTHILIFFLLLSGIINVN